MKIFYDAQAFHSQKYGGIPRYFAELYSQLMMQRDVEAIFPRCFSNNQYLPDKLKFCTPSLKLKGMSKIVKMMNIKISKNFLLKNRYDIFHPTYYAPYYLSLEIKAPIVLTVFDMIHELYPYYFGRRDRTSQNKMELINRADKIIAISESTKNDLCELTSIKPEKVEVVHLASSISDISPQQIELPENYCLFVGRRGAYKNFNFMTRAISKVLKQNKLYLFCAGGGMFTRNEVKIIRECGLEGLVLQKDVSEKQLKCCYTKAKVLIFPSLYEGFGLPILEAFSCSCPVILSKTNCFFEIAGEAGTYFEPENEVSICESFLTILNDTDRTKKLIRIGEKKLDAFSWEKTASKTLEVYKSLI